MTVGQRDSPSRPKESLTERLRKDVDTLGHMVQGLAGWHLLFLFLYLAVIVAGIVGLYFLIRLAVFHALKAHTRWVDKGKP